MAYLHAQPVPTAVYAASADWGADTELGQRITRAAGELAAVIQRQPAQHTTDPFTDPVPFEQLLSENTTR